MARNCQRRFLVLERKPEEKGTSRENCSGKGDCKSGNVGASVVITGTDYFVDRKSANSYYAEQGYSRSDVTNKITNKEIHIGKPPLKKGERLLIVDNGRRYAIETIEKKNPVDPITRKRVKKKPIKQKAGGNLIVDYHSKIWNELVESGWITKSVDNGKALMIPPDKKHTKKNPAPKNDFVFVVVYYPPGRNSPLYWTGRDTVTDSIRDAAIFKTAKAAKEGASYFKKRINSKHSPFIWYESFIPD